ncbi:MAG: hypothetical protein HYV26_23060 [Candidatus Hydrogenedentes bacterium]|nr:hypothetical protein [Candidatus Hydrogenedentota bacterium]
MVCGEFPNVTEVFGQIAADMLLRFPEAEGEFFFDRCGDVSPHSYRGPLKAILSAMSQYCGTFPGAWISYNPEHPYGHVVKVVGHCGKKRDECARLCGGFRERPRASILLTRVGARELLMGAKA